VPTAIVAVLFGMLFVGPAPTSAAEPELPAWVSDGRRRDEGADHRAA
jgi:hypothetical protein